MLPMYGPSQNVVVLPFRCGVALLYIETGRYTTIPSDEHLCVLCDQQVVDHEFHMLKKCDLYNDIIINN